MTPEECRSLEDIRAQIDRLDRTIVPLLIDRSRYVRRAADFKASASDVAAPGRQEVVYENVRRIAAEHGGDEVLIERIYRRLVAEFIADQETIWEIRRPSTGSG